jgi:hypothetical protein
VASPLCAASGRRRRGQAMVSRCPHTGSSRAANPGFCLGIRCIEGGAKDRERAWVGHAGSGTRHHPPLRGHAGHCDAAARPRPFCVARTRACATMVVPATPTGRGRRGRSRVALAASGGCREGATMLSSRLRCRGRQPPGRRRWRRPRAMVLALRAAAEIKHLREAFMMCLCRNPDRGVDLHGLHAGAVRSRARRRREVPHRTGRDL